MTARWKPPARLATPPDLAAEPEDVKALRLLRCLRHFQASRYGVTVFDIDGKSLMIIKVGSAKLPPEADVTPDSRA